MDAGPIRFKRDGAWVDIDSHLVRDANGEARPAAHPQGLKMFSGDLPTLRGKQGDRDLLTSSEGTSAGLSLAWRGWLPAPEIAGDTATYRDVTSGTDVKITTTATGFLQHTVIKSRPTGPVSFTMPLKLDGLSPRMKDGAGVDFLRADGTVVATMPAPQMWAANLDPVSQAPSKLSPVAYTLTSKPYGVDVTLTPDLAFLTDPKVQYPVIVDPDINFKGTLDTFVKDGVTSDQSASLDLQIGTDNTGKPARAFLNWDPASIRGKQIVEAHLGLWNSYSATCGSRAIDVYSAGLATTATRWAYSGSGTTGQPAIGATKAGSTSGSKGQASCEAGYINTDPHLLDALVQTWANTASGQVGMALKAPSETDVSYFKRVRSGENTSGKPYMYVTYNSLPQMLYRSTTPSTAPAGFDGTGLSPCTVGASRPVIGTSTPVLNATFTDEVALSTNVTFEWWRVGASQATGTASNTAVPVDEPTMVAVPALSNGDYMWRVKASSDVATSAWSPWCEFSVNRAVPTVTSIDYVSESSSGPAGTPGVFTLNAPEAVDAAAFLYGLDTTTPGTEVAPDSGTTSATVTITPPTNGAHTLYVRSRSAAGTLSPTAQYHFYVASSVTPPGAEIANDQDTSLSDSTTTSSQPGTVGAQAVNMEVSPSGCVGSTQNPHRSGHVPGTINVTGSTKCAVAVQQLKLWIKLYRSRYYGWEKRGDSGLLSTYKGVAPSWTKAFKQNAGSPRCVGDTHDWKGTSYHESLEANGKSYYMRTSKQQNAITC
ncbi:DNRLRE domain-containing protein [Actinoplanes sp. NPDC020271]|uniref:DNRLRE domain-containing protein n=1 Tax=Actinoplanes sp. NPDC020271 TaxID=3363896 RepID=UPI0037B9B6F7